MNNVKLKHHLRNLAASIAAMQSTEERLKALENEIDDIRCLFNNQTQQAQSAIYSLIGFIAGEEVSKNQTSEPTPVNLYLDNLIFENCKKESTPELIIQEVKNMLIQLTIKGSVRKRADGLIELRTQALGSIYGRTKEEIELKLTNKLKGQKHKKSNITPLFSEFFDNVYLPYKKKLLASSSIDDIILEHNYIVKKRNFDKPLNKYTSRQIEEFIYSIPQTRKRQKIRGVFNNIFNYAKRMGVIKNNPCDNVEQMKHEKVTGCALSFKSQMILFDKLYSNNEISIYEKLYITFVYLTGTRRTEALLLKPCDVDYENNSLHIAGTKTKSSDRTIPLFPLVRKLLQILDAQNVQEFYFPLTKSQASYLVKNILDHHHLHELRHTFGTIAICVQKLDAKTVSLYMGHSTVSMTLATYTHPEQLAKSVFYNGSLSENEKLESIRQEYNIVLRKIADFLDVYTQNLPN